MKKLNRRDLIKTLGIGAFVSSSALNNMLSKEFTVVKPFQNEKTSRKLTAIVLGAGNRGNVYGNYAVNFPDQLDIIGVAEPIKLRRERFSLRHNIPLDKQFTTWEHVFERKKFADIIIVTTPDNLHFGPAMAALEQGYDMLLEKPIAQKWQECADILALQKKQNAIVAVCHVLRYSPYYRKVKEVIESGVLGKMVSVQHFEPIEHVHMAHSFVRGNWRKEKETNPIILAKSCHDLDILRWWIDEPCQYVSSFGSLSWFKAENAPEGAPHRCTDGCPIESECPYSALQIYMREKQRRYVFDLPEDPSQHDDAVLNYITNGPYGRCVYHCDNDVLDHQVVSMQFSSGITANFNMEAFTNYHGRRTRIMGSMGCLQGDESDLYVANFKNDTLEHWNTKEHSQIKSGHGGGDWGLMSDFLNAVDKQDSSLLSSNLDASMDSHQIGFMAEVSRKEKRMVQIK